MTAVVERDPGLADRFRAALGPAATVLRSVEGIDDHLRQHPDEFAVVLGPSVDDATAARIAASHRIARPTLGVVLVRPAVDSGVLAEALRSGMRDVVATGDAEGLARAVEDARALAEAMTRSGSGAQAPATRDGRVLTVFSTKGGVGKSMVATNLAAALAGQGHRTCVLDLDVACGDVAIMLQLTPAHTLADLADLRGELDASAVASLLTGHSEGLSVLAAPVKLSAPLPPDRVGAVLETLRTMFDVVVVDTAAAFDDLSVQALDRSDTVVLVGTPDVPALKSLKLTAGTLDLLNVPRERWRLLLNRAEPKVGLAASEFEDTLGLKVSASLPSSRDVLAAVNRGEAVVRAKRGHQVGKALTAFAASLAPVPAPEAASGPAPAGRRSRRTRKVS
ncbi:MinD/ParA family protein [Nocardioides sp. GY 10113]|uniref:AAA family ATPase n=1 Tax=Nocardioides sp. GY 10113 TaxID=2569761 RepID=UPI0010A8BFB1|nr:P-loop NTPase [Nocardioides sp. GY 10113]TIC81307.1 MinD/ParA family protein [Nocardioides sp. GY 10113]